MYTHVFDYNKAFDTVKHEPLTVMLRNLDININDEHTLLLTNIYRNQQAVVRCNGEIDKWVNIKQCVRKGCVVSPHHFILCTEMRIQNIDGMEEFIVNGTVINNLRYADGTVIISESEEQLQCLINVIIAYSEEKGLVLNSAKSFNMVYSKSPTVTKCKPVVNSKLLEQV